MHGVHLGGADLRDRRLHRHHRRDLRQRATPSCGGIGFRFNPGGAVALAVGALPRARGGDGAGRALPQAAAVAADGRSSCPRRSVVVWLGTQLSTRAACSTRRPGRVLILAYCFVASLAPVWALLQPRGYLGGFVLYLALARRRRSASSSAASTIEQPAFKGFGAAGPTGSLFPFLFVTIACGACSGFHGLVCSGTTSKQIARETHCKPIGYGAMLLEAFVALIALATVMIVDPASCAGKAPGADLRRRASAASSPCSSASEHLVVRHHLRRDGVLDLRLRHARRRDPARPLHPAGAVRPRGGGRGGGRHRGDGRGAARLPAGGRTRLVRRGADCDDGVAAIHPGALDIFENGVDEDCDGRDAVNRDRDGDGFPVPADCNDADAAIRPGALEIRGNDVDENCDRKAERFGLLRSLVLSNWQFGETTRGCAAWTSATRPRARGSRVVQGPGCALRDQAR